MKKAGAAVAAMLLLGAVLFGCGKQEEAKISETDSDAKTAVSIEESQNKEVENIIRVGALKGPTTMGLLNMLKKAEEDKLSFEMEMEMAVTPDELTAKLVNGEMDIALIPANLASVLYNKTEGGIEVLNINTLGVIYGVTGDESVQSLEDLKGKTVYMTGQGSTPEFAFRHILSENGLSEEVQIEFKNEATEIAALMQKDPTITAVLPQPFATVCQMQNEGIREFMNLTEEWDACAGESGSKLVTGVTVVSRDFLKRHDYQKEDSLLHRFLAEQKASVQAAYDDTEGTAELIAHFGIIEKAQVAKKALPKCALSYIDGEEMKAALSGYLSVLYEANPKSVGGNLPDDAFYSMVCLE